MQFDSIVIGSGPNGFAAAITLAKAGLSTMILEANPDIGGGVRSAELTLSGFTHDVCSAIHPLAIDSPFFRQLSLEQYDLEFIHPPVELAHPLDDGTAVLLKRSIAETAKMLDDFDAQSYKKLFQPFTENWGSLAPEILAPLHFPKSPLLLARFGFMALRSARGLAKNYFHGTRARALFAGLAAHSMIPLENLPSAAFGLVLGTAAHAVGWGFPRGGAQKITDALSAYFQALGGKIIAGHRVGNLDDLPSAKLVLLDLTPRQILMIAGHRLSPDYKRKLENFKYGAGAFKVDWALNEPIPWKAKECLQAGTVHLGGTFDEIADGERRIARGDPGEKPFVLLAQTSLFDTTRAPVGKHTAWAYCHVPNGSDFPMTEIIENQIERFAPGFRDCVLARSIETPADMERGNSNIVGGDINGGAATLGQLFTRPVVSFNPYRMPLKNVYICSSSTPPGGGVHGMCGFHAARVALADLKIPTKFCQNREP